MVHVGKGLGYAVSMVEEMNSWPNFIGKWEAMVLDTIYMVKML